MSGVRGSITQKYVAHCGRCDATDYSYFQRRATAEQNFVMNGWLHTRLFGWVCPDCAPKGDTRDDAGERSPASSKQ